MSKIEIEFPDDGWFMAGSNVRPQYKQLCVVIHKYGGQMPWIYQYREADYLHPKKDYLLDVSEKWNLDSLGITEWIPSFLEWFGVDRWKPLGLPADINDRIIAEIEGWFEDGE